MPYSKGPPVINTLLYPENCRRVRLKLNVPATHTDPAKNFWRFWLRLPLSVFTLIKLLVKCLRAVGWCFFFFFSYLIIPQYSWVFPPLTFKSISTKLFKKRKEIKSQCKETSLTKLSPQLLQVSGTQTPHPSPARD